MSHLGNVAFAEVQFLLFLRCVVDTSEVDTQSSQRLWFDV